MCLYSALACGVKRIFLFSRRDSKDKKEMTKCNTASATDQTALGASMSISFFDIMSEWDMVTDMIVLFPLHSLI